MTLLSVCLWAGYAGVLLLLAHVAKGENVLLPGRVGAVVQSFAYVATYVSAVALVGFAGLGHGMGMQIQFVTFGCVWFGCWMVYRYVAWPTRVMQRAVNAETPIELMAKGFSSKRLGTFYGILSGVLILVYCSAVFKGGAVILASAVPLTEGQALWLLVALVAICVLWGGLRAVLYTEALQGFVMTLGVLALLVGALRYVGGFSPAMEALAALPPTEQANRGFLAVSSGAGGLNIIFLMLVTSVGVWAQPQMVQRHFALKSKSEARSIVPMAMLIIAVLLGGALFVGGISQLILGSAPISADLVIPRIVRMVLPEIFIQFFALAIVSASLSTASALLHVSCATLGRDVLGRKLQGAQWKIAVILCALAAGAFAVRSSSIIALICSTSWTLVAAAMWVPYIALIFRTPGLDGRSGWMASITGILAALGWYYAGYAPTSLGYSGMAAGGMFGHIHPMLVGMLSSATGLGMGLLWGRLRGKSAAEINAATA